MVAITSISSLSSKISDFAQQKKQDIKTNWNNSTAVKVAIVVNTILAIVGAALVMLSSSVGGVNGQIFTTIGAGISLSGAYMTAHKLLKKPVSLPLTPNGEDTAHSSTPPDVARSQETLCRWQTDSLDEQLVQIELPKSLAPLPNTPRSVSEMPKQRPPQIMLVPPEGEALFTNPLKVQRQLEDELPPPAKNDIVPTSQDYNYLPTVKVVAAVAAGWVVVAYTTAGVIYYNNYGNGKNLLDSWEEFNSGIVQAVTTAYSATASTLARLLHR